MKIVVAFKGLLNWLELFREELVYMWGRDMMRKKHEKANDNFEIKICL